MARLAWEARVLDFHEVWAELTEPDELRIDYEDTMTIRSNFPELLLQHDKNLEVAKERVLSDVNTVCLASHLKDADLILDELIEVKRRIGTEERELGGRARVFVIPYTSAKEGIESAFRQRSRKCLDVGLNGVNDTAS